MVVVDAAGFWVMCLWEFTTQFSTMEIPAWDLRRQPKDDPLHIDFAVILCDREDDGDCVGEVLVLWHLSIREHSSCIYCSVVQIRS
jgi:hypothetical protein